VRAANQGLRERTADTNLTAETRTPGQTSRQHAVLGIRCAAGELKNGPLEHRRRGAGRHDGDARRGVRRRRRGIERLRSRNVVIFRNSGDGSAIASTYSWWSGSTLIDSDIIFWDGPFTFFGGASGCGGSNAAYITDIAAHEFGHAIGLNHSTVGDATMYPGYSTCSQIQRTLAADDVAGALTVSVMATVFEEAPAALTVMVPLYVPALSPAVFTLVVNVLLPLPDAGLTASHEAPSLTVQFNVPPELVREIF